jgi:hypothetical protein
MTETTARRVTRRSAFRGQQLTATLRDGSTVTGSMLGWGASFLRLSDNGKWTELSTCQLETVTAAQA